MATKKTEKKQPAGKAAAKPAKAKAPAAKPAAKAPAAKPAAKPAARKPETKKSESPAPTYQMINRRAYEIWEAKGRPEGTDAENWAQAERELRGQG